jgi:hypothetical protein
MLTSRSTCDARPSVDARPEPGAAARERVDFAQQRQRGHRRQRRHRRDGERARDVLEGAEARDGRDVRVVDELDARRSVDGLELVEARDRLQPRALQDDEVAADVHELVEAVQVLEHGVAVEDQVALDGADGRDGRRVEVRRRLLQHFRGDASHVFRTPRSRVAEVELVDARAGVADVVERADGLVGVGPGAGHDAGRRAGLARDRAVLADDVAARRRRPADLRGARVVASVPGGARGPKTAAPARAQSQSLLGLPFLNQDVESPPQLRAAPWHCTWQLA